MNAKARLLGMRSTQFADSTGLDGNNVSTARIWSSSRTRRLHTLDPRVHHTAESEVEPGTRRTPMLYRNSNRLCAAGTGTSSSARRAI